MGASVSSFVDKVEAVELARCHSECVVNDKLSFHVFPLLLMCMVICKDVNNEMQYHTVLARRLNTASCFYSEATMHAVPLSGRRMQL